MPVRDLQQQARDHQDVVSHEDDELRNELLGTITHLFVNQTQHSTDEIRQFEAAAEGLLPHTNKDVRLKTAEALADYPYTPLGVVKAFLAIGGDLATPFQRRSVCMPRTLVSEYAKNGEMVEACNIANRVDLDDTQVALLCARQEIEVLRAVARNAMAPLDPGNFESLVRQARFDRQLARALCMRARDPLAIAPIFMFANTAQRDAIILATRRAGLGAPLAEPLSDVEVSIADELLEAAETRNLDEASWLVARAVGCTSTLARDIIADASGEPLALVLAMLRIEVEAASRVLAMFDAPPMRSADRIKALSNIIRDMPRACAERLLKTMVGLSGQRVQTDYMPVSDPSAAQTPSRPAEMGALIAVLENAVEQQKRFLLKR